MENNVIFKRLNKNSTLSLFDTRTCDFKTALENMEMSGVVLQIVQLSNDLIILEDLPAEMLDSVPTKEAEDNDSTLAEYFDTVLNNDPFHMGFSGKKLGDIWASDQGMTWFEKAKISMRNEYIRDRVLYILKNAKR